MNTVQLKIKRYEGRIEQYRQNRMLGTNQKITDGVHRTSDKVRDSGECLEFWSGIWSKPKIPCRCRMA